MSRINPEANPESTDTFLKNLPEEYRNDFIIKLTFEALDPEQQKSALKKLKELFGLKSQLNAIEMAVYIDAELGAVMNVIFPDIQSRIAFWQAFLNEDSSYQA